MRIPKALTLASATGLLALSAVMVAGPAAAAPSTQDTTFITTNAETNLAEIAIGTIAQQRATSQVVKDLAAMTLADHKDALAKLTTVAQGLGVTLPTEPNAEQKANAATLTNVSTDAFDLTYAQIQVAGHLKSIAGTNTEISSGADPTVVGYAQGYLPVAQMHLDMATTAVTELGGDPTAVPGGTGGAAATTAPSTYALQIGLGATGVLLVLGGGMALRRRNQH